MALAVILPGMSAPAWAQLRAKKKELRRIQQEIESTNRQIEEYEGLEQILSLELSKIEARKDEARQKTRELQSRLKLSQQKRQELRSRLGALGQASGLWKSALDSDVRLYAQSLFGREEFFASHDLWRSSFERQAILDKVLILSSLAGASRRTALVEVETQRKARELLHKSWKADAEGRRHVEEFQKAKAAMADAQEKAAAARDRVRELEESAKALTKLLTNLSRARPGPADARWSVPRHSLPWPVAGSVVQPFGRQRNAELNTWVIHQGIRIQTPPSAPVAAIRAGQVIFTGPFRSYGKVLILDHGANFFSIYGELSGILKSKGARVAAGEVVARAGGASEEKFGMIYLELRHGMTALDPLAWLKK